MGLLLDGYLLRLFLLHDRYMGLLDGQLRQYDLLLHDGYMGLLLDGYMLRLLLLHDRYMGLLDGYMLRLLLLHDGYMGLLDGQYLLLHDGQFMVLLPNGQYDVLHDVHDMDLPDFDDLRDSLCD